MASGLPWVALSPSPPPKASRMELLAAPRAAHCGQQEVFISLTSTCHLISNWGMKSFPFIRSP